MGKTVDELITKYTLDARGYRQNAQSVVLSTAATATALGRMRIVAQGAGQSLMGFASMAAPAFSAMATAAGGAAAAVIGIGFAAAKQAADFEALNLAMVAVTGSAEAAEIEMRRLREVAKLPGLGYKEAIQASIALQSAGFSADLAERSIRSFGNALATAGKGKAELGLVIRALSQIATKSKLSAEEINTQLGEALPLIKEVMHEIYGTADVEALAKRGVSPQQFIIDTVTYLEKAKQVVGGAKNSFENFADNIDVSLAEIGKVVNKHLAPTLDVVSGFLTYLSDSGIFQRIAENFANLFGVGKGEDGLITLLSQVTAFIEEIPAKVAPIVSFFSGVVDVARWAILSVGTLFDGLATFVNSTVGALFRALGSISIGSWKPFSYFDKVGSLMNASKQAMTGFLNIVEGSDSDRSRQVKADYRAAASRAAEIPERKDGKSGFKRAAESAAVIQTAKNTKEIAEQSKKFYDLTRNVFGGGDIGRHGVTPVDIARNRRGGGGAPVQVNVAGTDSISEMIQQVVDQIFWTSQYRTA